MEWKAKARCEEYGRAKHSNLKYLSARAKLTAMGKDCVVSSSESRIHPSSTPKAPLACLNRPSGQSEAPSPSKWRMVLRWEGLPSDIISGKDEEEDEQRSWIFSI